MSQKKQKPKLKDKEKDADYLRKKKEREKIKNKIKEQKATTKNVRNIGEYEIDLESHIGFGTFGTVYKAYKNGNEDVPFACKHIHEKKIANMQMYDDGNGKSNKERLEDQIATHKELSQSNYIVRLYDVKQEKDGYYLFMEMCDSDLGKIIKDRGSLSQENAMEYFRQLIEGYQFLYSKKISHRDLKPENLLISGDSLKISDFGFVKTYQNVEAALRPETKSKFLAQSIVGSINYMAPQILKAEHENNKYNPFLSDVWSMGVILYKMLYNQLPYFAHTTQELLKDIQSKDLKFPEKPQISKKTINLLKQMIEKDPKNRITFNNLSNLILDNGYQDKQKELLFYNLLMTKISYDSANHATIREIGIEEYQKFSARLMSLIHEKRVNLLEKTSNIDVSQEIKNQISVYANTFHYQIKYVAELNKFEGGLLSLLTIYRQKLADYADFSLLHKRVQYFLILLLLLYNFQKKNVSIDYISTVIQNEKNNKITLTILQNIKNKNISQ